MTMQPQSSGAPLEGVPPDYEPQSADDHQCAHEWVYEPGHVGSYSEPPLPSLMFCIHCEVDREPTRQEHDDHFAAEELESPCSG